MRTKLVALGLFTIIMGACNNSEELPSEEGAVPRNIPGAESIDSMHRYPPVPEADDTDSMIDLRTGKPKIPGKDTI